MNKRVFHRWVNACAVIFGLLWAWSTYAGLPLGPDGSPATGLAPMLERVVPGVVNISTRARIRMRENPLLSDPFFRRFFDLPNIPRERESQSVGSGVIVDAAKGYIITNHHVIDKADEVAVTLRDGRRFDAKVLGVDPEADLAVIRIEASGLTRVPLGDSDRLRVGDVVVAIGNPFGLSQTVTSGIVSALGRTGLGIEGYEDFIQTDASINPGNSGGALVNIGGELVGINTAIVGPSGGNIGIGFAIPSNMARQIMAQLVEHGEVRRGRLGVVVQNLTPDLAQAFGLTQRGGAVVAQVAPGSPADKAGLKPGDVITTVNGQPVRNSSALRNTIGLLRVGSKVTLGILRDGRPKTLRAVITEPEQTRIEAGRTSKHLAGAVLGGIEAGHPLADRVEGVQVLEVERGSRAWRAGLRQGDIIASVNRQPVKSIGDLSSAIQRSPHSLLLNIRRGNSALFIVIQ